MRPAPIGGDFGLDARVLDEASAAEPQPAPPPLFATGRAALTALACRPNPRTGAWLVPDYMCGVVPQALRAAGRDVIPYPWRSLWDVDADALTRLLSEAAGVVVPFAFGRPPSDDVWRVLEGTDARVVEDRCQCPAAPPPPNALRGHAAIGSFRKWMPTPDGAYAVVRDATLAPDADGLPDMVALRTAAALVKSLRQDGRLAEAEPVLEPASVELFRLGETLAVGQPGQAPRASRLAERLVAAADVEAIHAARLRNQQALAAALEGNPHVRVLGEAREATTNGIPLLALPVTATARDEVRARLAEARVFCAVHWVDGDWAATGGRPAEWAATLLSLPIDQRYTPADMARIAEALR